MRMWMCDPRILCTKHLLGSHVELHMLVGSLLRKKRLDNFFNNNLLQLCDNSIVNYHNEIVKELENRGYNHRTSLNIKEDIYSYLDNKYKTYRIDKQKSLDELLNRCEKCRQNYNSLKQI